MHWSASLKRRTNWQSAPIQQYVKRFLHLNNSHQSGPLSQTLDVIQTFLCSSLTERHEVRWTDCCVWVSVPGEAREAEVFPGEGRFDICPAGGALCTGTQELHLCFPLILSGVNDGTCRKRLRFRWHFLPVLTSWSAGAVQQCQALSLFPLKVLFLLLFTGCSCVFWERERVRACVSFGTFKIAPKASGRETSNVQQHMKHFLLHCKRQMIFFFICEM